MSSPSAKRVAKKYLERGRTKTAGEVIFRKDNSGDASQWAFSGLGPSQRAQSHGFNYSPKNLKPLAACLRSSLIALGHVFSAYENFSKIKSATISPDGNLGGKGYIQKISDMRRQYMNIIEALSSLTDTEFDECKAPHWAVMSRQDNDEDKAEVAEMLEDSEKIRKDPETWATDSVEDEFGEDDE